LWEHNGKRLIERDDLRTVPQIYINDELNKGGYTGLKKYLEEQK
jgi:glutaredoxin